MKKVKKTKEEWKKALTDKQYHILIEKGTEAPFSGELHDKKSPGLYVCAACGSPLFSSETKFDSGTGWPSFYAPATLDSLENKKDFKLIIPRNEVLCKKCGGHLGHVFKDGPAPTGLRYCINSAALKFKKGKKSKKS